VVRRAARPILAGLAVGLAGALSLTRVLEGMLFNVAPSDALTFTSAMLVLTAAAFVACVVPASIASRIDPIRTLRGE
jgi:putative ABC transport system permease protein